jgi:HEPN domain-containing protein
MKKNDIVKDWIKRAKSNLVRANQTNTSPEVLLEDLSFDCQQAVEKALKALLRFYDLDIPKTHSIGLLLSVLESNSFIIPSNVQEGVILTDYAVQTRYPGDYEPVTKDEYAEILTITNSIFDWIISIINK